MKTCIDLNSDVGESYGAFKVGEDEEILACVSSANIACGWHGGDPLTMRRTVEAACRWKVGIGAHPGYPDLLGFGRRPMAISGEEARAYVLYQVGALAAFVRAAGGRMQHVKLHGAFYNQAAGDVGLAEGVVNAVHSLDPELILLGLSGSRLLALARERGLRVAHEFFADRAYAADGTLLPRSAPGAIMTDPAEAAARALRIVKEGVVQSVDGRLVSVVADSICVHGDHPAALSFARAIRDALRDAGVFIRPLSDVVL